MAEYYDMQETMDKLRKSEQEVQELVKQGQLRQYMDSGKPVFKTEDIDAMAEEIVGLDISSIGITPESSETDIQLEETSEIQLQPDEPETSDGTGADDLELSIEPDKPGDKNSEGGFGLSQMGDLTMADTNVGTVGINILSGTGDAYQLTDDTRAETTAGDIDDLDSLDADANLESFGSGSGLLDLSLQADDTSLGAVLDDILPAGAEGAEAGGGDLPVEEIGLVDEGEDLMGSGQEPAAEALTDQEAVAPLGTAVTAPVIPTAQPVPAVMVVDSKSTIFGIMMFLPMISLILAAIVLTAAIQDVVPSLLKILVETEVAGIGLIWIIVAGVSVLLLLVLAVSAVSGGSGGAKKTKTAKAKKEKKPKKAKPAKKKRK